VTLVVTLKQELHSLPIISNVDFGHTSPMITFPVDETCELNVAVASQQIKLVEH